MSVYPILGIAGTTILADAIWLTFNNKYHSKLLYDIQGSPMEVRWFPAIFVYLLIILAVYYFAVRISKNMYDATMNGAFIGFAMYGLYDLTNYATLKNYTFSMTLTDILWGTFLCAMSATVGFFFLTLKYINGIRFKTLWH